MATRPILERGDTLLDVAHATVFGKVLWVASIDNLISYIILDNNTKNTVEVRCADAVLVEKAT